MPPVRVVAQRLYALANFISLAWTVGLWAVVTSLLNILAAISWPQAIVLGAGLALMLMPLIRWAYTKYVVQRHYIAEVLPTTFGGGKTLMLRSSHEPDRALPPTLCSVVDPVGKEVDSYATKTTQIWFRYPEDFPGAPERPLPPGKYTVSWSVSFYPSPVTVGHLGQKVARVQFVVHKPSAPDAVEHQDGCPARWDRIETYDVPAPHGRKSARVARCMDCGKWNVVKY